MRLTRSNSGASGAFTCSPYARTHMAVIQKMRHLRHYLPPNPYAIRVSTPLRVRQVRE